MKGLISIVVPVYAVEAYLERCIKSLLSQSYRNLEIILVDDGSPDKCPEICDKYAAVDNRVKVIHKENGGLSDARNTGLAIVSGDFVAFIDSDDYVSRDYIKILYETIVKTDANIASCDFYRTFDGEIMGKSKAKKSVTLSNVDALRDTFLTGSRIEVMTWNKLYEVSLFRNNNIAFPVGKLHEDNFTTYKLLYFSDRVAYVADQLYYYVQREDSIMGRKFNVRRLDILEAVDETSIFLNRYDLSVQLGNELVSYRLLILLDLVTSYALSGLKDSTIGSRLKYELKNLKCLNNPLISSKHKLMFMLARIGFFPYGIARRLFEVVK